MGSGLYRVQSTTFERKKKMKEDVNRKDNYNFAF